jgi:hypothetical protein
MKPTHCRRATLSDLLDRVLDKGIVLNADLVISLADVPLIGVNLRAAIAGMETMVRYGLMRDYDMEKNAWVKEGPPMESV